jgi:hypothetical protein
MLFRLVAFFKVGPVGVVLLVGCPFAIDNLLDDLLCGLCAEHGECERKEHPTNCLRFLRDHCDCLRQKFWAFDAPGLANGS